MNGTEGGGGGVLNRLVDSKVETVSDLAHFETPRSSTRKRYTHEDIAYEDITLEDVTHTRRYTRRQSKQGSSLKFVHVTFPPNCLVTKASQVYSNVASQPLNFTT